MTILHTWTYGFVVGVSCEKGGLLIYLGPWAVCFDWRGK